jgi:hypothetical protein
MKREQLLEWYSFTSGFQQINCYFSSKPQKFRKVELERFSGVESILFKIVTFVSCINKGTLQKTSKEKA